MAAVYAISERVFARSRGRIAGSSYVCTISVLFLSSFLPLSPFFISCISQSFSTPSVFDGSNYDLRFVRNNLLRLLRLSIVYVTCMMDDKRPSVRWKGERRAFRVSKILAAEYVINGILNSYKLD